MDTQWPRYEVFTLERPGAAYEHAGSVHAVDSEMALLNARDVYARRPEIFSMWAVPARAVFGRTRQELSEQGTGASQDDPGPSKTYHVCCKEKTAGTQTLLGQVTAASPGEALAKGMQKFLRPETPADKQPFAWWVFPAQAVIESQAGDVESFFAPARDKTFRLATEYHTHSAMRKLKK